MLSCVKSNSEAESRTVVAGVQGKDGEMIVKEYNFS